MKYLLSIRLGKLLLAGFVLLLLPGFAGAAVLTTDTVWQGKVTITDDILVPEGITLTVRPGTTIAVEAAESTKTDPEYLSPLTEITVRGTLTVEGSDAAPVVFSGVEKKQGSWTGLVIDHGAATLSGCRIADAETAVHVVDGVLKATGVLLRDNRYGLVAQGDKARVTLDGSRISGNDYGLFSLWGAQVTTAASEIAENRKKDSYSAASKEYLPPARNRVADEIPVSRRYSDKVLRGDTVWQGRIEVDGIIRVPEGSRLVILPGTTIEFLKKDTNGDGIGENGLMIQGRIIAKGSVEHPIIFRSAEKERKAGDWDAINIMNSSGAQNLIEYCRIEDAYRGLHFHFATVAVHRSQLTNNYRGVQFQESLVDIRDNELCGNRSGIQGRDSDITFSGNLLCNNYQGANFFRTTLVARGNRIIGNRKEGFRVREGVSTLQENLIDGNRYGLMVADMYYGDYSRNSITNNLEVGFSLRNVDNIEIGGNAIAGNGINGLTVQEGRAIIKGNQFTDNGERGIGIQSFAGLVTENNFGSNGLYAIDLEGKQDLPAPANWWGGADVEKVIFDKKDDPAKGRVAHEKDRVSPVPFVWPLPQLSTDMIWRGVITVSRPVTVLNGARLMIAPGTRVQFAHGVGMAIKGRLIAKGLSGQKIVFTSLEKKGASDWDELLLEYATGSQIDQCRFEYATWGIHSHFTNLTVLNSHFTNNYGGMRFRSGPVEIKGSLFENNYIGIRAYLGNAVITENTITRNETGIFVREKGGGLAITRNDMFDNRSYNIRIGDFNDEDVNAAGNWWGKGDPLTTIFDARREPGIGTVIYEPYLKLPARAGQGVGK